MKLVVRPWLWTLTGAALIVLIGLGTWQVQRLAWKNDLIARVEARTGEPPKLLEDLPIDTLETDEWEYAPVSVSGGFHNGRTAHVVGTYEGQAGFYAFQAMRLDDGSGALVLINRGFVPQDQRSDYYPLPDAERMVGLARFYAAPQGLSGAFAPPNDPINGTFYSRDPEALASYLTPGEEDRYLAIAVDSTLLTELPRGGTTRLDFRNAHLGYAITWFGLAAGLAMVTGLLSRRPAQKG